ncbi:FecR family protein [Chitinophaga filiformis]|uniref:FecR domain-containing protein n=1 Tax=Chitinophaga filiformis TaxID=104663 RepID=A0ABY4HSY3_CHIFI|nr:FecR family protein [Chitinophaga filiformis]UPK66700.1 FecR domain-containing protein [Chitinophaga filiformis]
MEDIFHEEELRSLFGKFLQKDCSETEIRRLMEYADIDQLKSVWEELLSDVEVEGTAGELYVLYQQPVDKVFRNLSFLTDELPQQEGSRGIFSLSRYWWAAAAVFLLLLSGTWFFMIRPQRQGTVIATVYDRAPGTDKALLTLADGKVVPLDSTGKEQLVQGNTAIQQQGGLLKYSAGAHAAGFNTLSTPRGGQFRVVLPDGTAVWLNAATSLRYPTAFDGNERVVMLRGEAYFEVAKNARPFRVQIDERTAVEVLGTHFNIHAYSDENQISTTLLEGKVIMTRSDALLRRVVLNPGQQAIADKEQLGISKQVNIDQVMAWKNGMFNFEGMDLPSVLRQLARWYDVEIIYEGKIPTRKFGGEMQRDLSLQQVLRILERMDVKCRIENGNRLIVM